ncbi:MAG: polysaccharide deacetylase family protein [Candidatus Omnitrophica bacterium]|nr:polysaccharide deacetylase family protein [Candidatus Omnitrophota bacterium]
MADRRMITAIQRATSAIPGGAALKQRLHDDVTACGVTYWHLARRQDPGFTMMTYHRILAGLDPYYADGLPLATLKTQLKFFKRFCRVLSLDEIVSRLEAGKPLPRRCVTLTFDDGFRDTYTLALPLLRRYRLPATVYVTIQALERGILSSDIVRYAMRQTRAHRVTVRHTPTQPLEYDLSSEAARLRTLSDLQLRLTTIPNDERLTIVAAITRQLLGCLPEEVRVPDLMLTWEQVREMAAHQVTIGAHTLSHAVLTRLPLQQATEEIVQSKRILESRLQRPVEHFAYPHGAPWCVSPAVRDEVERAGFRSACTTLPGLNTPQTDRWLLRRVDGRQASLRSFVRYLTGQ